MLLLHLSDLHLGVETYGHIDPATGLSFRLTDALSALDRAVDFAIENKVDLFLFCGDAYKSRDPSQTHQREFARRISRLSEAGIQIFLLAGNHDLPAAPSRAHAVEIFHTLNLLNVTVASRPQTHLIETKSGPLQVVALPWVQRRALLAKEEHRDLSLEQMDEKVREIVTSWLREELQGLREDIPALLAGHLTLDSARVGSERGLMLGRDPVFLKADISALHPNLDYVALGHVHRHQALSQEPPIVYSGSLMALDFGEEGDEKGFCLVEIDPSRPAGRRATWTFHPVPSRPFLTIEAHPDLSGPNPTEAVLKAILLRKDKLDGAIVRLKLQASAEDRALVDESALRRALAPAHYVAAISWADTSASSRVRLPLEPGMAPLEALRRYLQTRELSKERLEALMQFGGGLLQEAQAEAEP